MNSYKGLEMQLDTIQKKRLLFSELFSLKNKIQSGFASLMVKYCAIIGVTLSLIIYFANSPIK